jgi:hypothetical protein
MTGLAVVALSGDALSGWEQRGVHAAHAVNVRATAVAAGAVMPTSGRGRSL